MVSHTRCNLALICALVLCTFQAPAHTPDVTALGRIVALDHATVTSGAAISLLLSEAHAPGGIISMYDNCAQPSAQVFSLEETTLKQSLDYVSRIDGSRKWFFTNGLIIVGSELTGKTILDSVIHDIDIDPSEALSITTQRLLNTPEVRSRVQRAGLNELTPELGFAQIRKDPGSTPVQLPVKRPKHLHRTTLQDALNVAAAMKGTGVWEYEQYTCKSKSSFRLDWVVK